jgi:predicted GNAT family acetyltransferase
MPGPRKPLGKPIVKKKIQKPTPNRFIQTGKVKHEFELLGNLRTRLQQKRKQIEEIKNSKLSKEKKKLALKIFKDQVELIKKQMGEARDEMRKDGVAEKLFKEGVEKFTRKK